MNLNELTDKRCPLLLYRRDFHSGYCIGEDCAWWEAKAIPQRKDGKWGWVGTCVIRAIFYSIPEHLNDE